MVVTLQLLTALSNRLVLNGHEVTLKDALPADAHNVLLGAYADSWPLTKVFIITQEIIHLDIHV